MKFFALMAGMLSLTIATTASASTVVTYTGTAICDCSYWEGFSHMGDPISVAFTYDSSLPGGVDATITEYVQLYSEYSNYDFDNYVSHFLFDQNPQPVYPNVPYPSSNINSQAGFTFSNNKHYGDPAFTEISAGYSDGNIHDYFNGYYNTGAGYGSLMFWLYDGAGSVIPVGELSFNVTSVSIDGTPRAEAMPVPEPATWAMMLLGFGGLGAVLRRQRRSPVAA
jgi:hypothetical protein